MSSNGNLAPARRSTRRSSSTSSLAALAEAGPSRRRSSSVARADSGETHSFKFANSAKTMAIIDNSPNGTSVLASIGFENIAILNISNLKMYNFEERIDYFITFFPVLLTQGEIHYLKRCTNYKISQEDGRTFTVPPVEDEEGDTKRYLVHLQSQWIDYRRLISQYKGERTEELIKTCNKRIAFSKAPFLLQDHPSLA